jgi:hypothetical protein
MPAFDPTKVAKQGVATPTLNNQQYYEREVTAMASTLGTKQHADFDSIVSKYPNLSKDLAIAAVMQGLNANTPGIDKLATMDGIAQLKQDNINLKAIAGKSKDNKNFAQSVADMLYGGFKGVVRTGFAVLQAPYQYFTKEVRDIYALTHGQSAQVKADNPLLGVFGSKETNIGQIISALTSGQRVDTGNGFFINPDSKISRAQAKAMSAYGQINGKSFTIGRMTANGLGADPNSNFYKIMSGAVDAVLSIAADPSTYVGPGIVTKTLQASKLAKIGQKAVAARAAAEEIKTADTAIGLKTLGQKQLAEKALTDAKGQIRRDFSDDIVNKEQEALQAKADFHAAEVERTKRIHTAGIGLEKSFIGSPEASKVLSNDNIGNIILDTVKNNTQPSIIRRLGRMSAAEINSAKAVAGHVIVEELPDKGKTVLGAMGKDEFVLTKVADKELRRLDIADNTLPQGAKETEKEISRRLSFKQQIERGGNSTRISWATRQNLRKIAEELDPRFHVGLGETSLSTVLAKAATLDKKSVTSEATEYLMKAIKNIWKPEVIDNVYSIYGQTGGSAIIDLASFAGRKVNMSKILDGTMAPRLGAQTIVKLEDAIVNKKNAVLETRQALKEAREASKENYRRIQEVNAIKSMREADPTIVKKIMNESEYQDVRHLLDLKQTVDNAQDAYKEWLLAESGMTAYMGGKIAPNMEKALSFILGKNFDHVIKIVADQKDPLEIWRLFGRKIDLNLAKDLANAETIGAVERTLLQHLGSQVDDPTLYRSLSLRMQASGLKTSPRFKLVAPVSDKVIDFARKSEEYFGRYFVRQMVINLDDADAAVRSVESWATSAGFSIKDTDSVLKNIIKAKNPEERSAAIMNGFQELISKMAKDTGNPELTKILENEVRIHGRAKIINNEYLPGKQATNSVPTVILSGGGKKELPSAFLEHQFLDDMLKLPDSREVKNLLESYSKHKIYYGSKKAGRVFSSEFGDRWRTLQLVFRASYILRNVAEMQMRQFFAGHESFFNHPMGYLAMVLGDSEGNAFQKFLARSSKYSNDVLDKSFTSTSLDEAVGEGVLGYQAMMTREMSSHDPRLLWTGRYYRTVLPGDPAFYKSLAMTLQRYHTDELVSKVAGAITEADKTALVKSIIRDADKPGSVVSRLIGGSKKTGGESNFSFLLNEPALGVSRGNINEYNLRSYLFGVDGADGDSILSAVNTVTGGNELLRELIATGKTLVTRPNGKAEAINMPRFSVKAGTDPMKEAEKYTVALKSALYRNFTPEDLKAAKVIGASDYAKLQSLGVLNRASNWFFNLSTRIENNVNYGPEFRMAYWDAIAQYIPMLKKTEFDRLKSAIDSSLRPLTVGRKFDANGNAIAGTGKAIGKNHIAVKMLNQELKKTTRDADLPGVGLSLDTLDSVAAKVASKHVQNLFYDATKTRQVTQAFRLIFPFAQAQANTLYKWTELAAKNPVKIYRAAKAYDALTKPGSGAIYDLFGVNHEANQGFFYNDQFGEKRFMYPLAGKFMGGLTGGSIDASQAVELTAPVQSLNLAFGAVNPLVPGIGPTGQAVYQVVGGAKLFGAGWDSMRNIIFPFGAPKNVTDYVLPAWLKKGFLTFMNDQNAAERGTQDWASYLASTGDYGDNPLQDATSRDKLFNDAKGIAVWANRMQAFFQNIMPATPSTEIFIHDKNGSFRMQTTLFNSYRDMELKHPGDRNSAIREFVDKWGVKNLLTILSGTTRAVQGTGDAWDFLNKNPKVADKYITSNIDVVPYFFPGGESSMAYFKWQKDQGIRRTLTARELEDGAAVMAYEFAKSQISEDQATYGYNDYWYNDKITQLNEEFGGSPPPTEKVFGSGPARIAAIRTALKDKVFQQSPVYNEVLQYVQARDDRKAYLRQVTGTQDPQFTSNGLAATRLRDELNMIAGELIQKNPAFAVMFYRVFAGELRK